MTAPGDGELRTRVTTSPAVGLSVMPQAQYLTATLPLFEAGIVDAIEWSFDMSWQPGLPGWLAGLIADYEAAGRLSGHGVSLSPLSTHPRQDLWFERFGHDVANHRFSHVSEHFGFMAAGDFRLGPPLPLPMTNDTLQIGVEHLKRLAAMTNGQVGLENLAFAFGLGDVWAQGEFLEALLAPVDGFLVLDVHNLWCQVVNFGLDANELLATYPVDRVRECHVSGGSWNTCVEVDLERTIRRDTHDGAVPDDVFDLLGTVLAACPNVQTVIVEQIGDAFSTAQSGETFRRDFERVRQVVTAPRVSAEPATGPSGLAGVLDHSTFPAELMSILADAGSATDAQLQLRRLDGDDRDWLSWVNQMDDHMVATAIELVASWGRRT